MCMINSYGRPENILNSLPYCHRCSICGTGSRMLSAKNQHFKLPNILRLTHFFLINLCLSQDINDKTLMTMR